jgi:hypothetical protein
MAGNLITAYPVFESGQLLTSSQLNDTRLYLDENLRANRKLLNGVGVVSGLEVNFNSVSSTITISRGMGITTDGYLIPVTAPLTFTRADDYKETEGDPLEPIYPQFIDPDTQIPFDMFELLVSAGPYELTGDTGGIEDIESYVVVLFLKEVIDEQSTFCVSTDTDSSGSVRRYDLKPLLLHKDDFDKLTAYNNEAQTANNNPVNVLKMKRFISSLSADLIDFDSETPIRETYSAIIGEYRLSVATRIKNAYNSYKAYFGLNYNESSQTFDQLVDSFFTEDIIADNIIHIQYLYAFLKDLIDACDEFSESAYNSFKDYLPANVYTLDTENYLEPSFPRHLALGVLTPPESMPGMVYKQKYRYYFTEQFRMEVKEKEVLKAQLLFERIMLMIKTFTVPPFITDVPVLVTPSMDEDAPLSKRAIPYYYNLKAPSIGERLYMIWNPEAYLRNQSTSSTYSATVQEDNDSTTKPAFAVADHIKYPLLYNINTNDFYRIEGHLGRGIAEAISGLEDIRRAKNLDFNIVSLELTTATPVDPEVENHNMNLFHHFVDVNHGIEHKGGVEEGGTFILVHFEGNVVADFALPSQSPYSAILY